MAPDFHRGTLGDDISMGDYIWSPDGSKLALASVSRDHKHVWLRVADTATGAVRTVFDETVPTQFESRTGWQVLWRDQRSRSGTPSATTGASSISTICRPAS